MAYTPISWMDRAVQYAKRYFVRDNGGSDKNLLPPFNEGWTLHENTRMRQANFVGKVSGSTTVNPHRFARYNSKSILDNPANYPVDAGQSFIDAITTLNGITAALSTTVNTNIAQDLFSFNLIEHVIRNYGVGVFGTAVTTAERVAWLKAGNITKFNFNWHGNGSGPSGNKATVSVWNGVAWSGAATNLTGSIAKVNINLTPTAGWIDTNGFVHFLAYADASNGTIASTINTDFVELEVYMAAGSIPQADYELALNATAGNQYSNIYIPVTPNTIYSISAENPNNQTLKAMFYSDNTYLSSAAITQVGSIARGTFTTPSNCNRVLVELTNTLATVGLVSFKNPQLELGSTVTPFEPMRTYTITQSPGTVTQAGTPINAANMNRLETGLQAAAGIADSALDKVLTKIMADATNANALLTSGRYYIFNAANAPIAAIGMYYDVIAHSASYVVQNAYLVDGNRIFTRRLVIGTWTVWTKVSNETTRVTVNSNLNFLLEDGSYVVDGASTNSPVAGLNYYVTTLRAPDQPTYLKQVAYHANGNRVWTRTCEGGSWSAWDELYTSTANAPHVSGSFTGNGAATRDIALPFTPSAIIIMPQNSTLFAALGSVSAAGGLAVTGSNVNSSSANEVVIGTNKVTVKYDSSLSGNAVSGTNTSGKIYNYIAFR